MKEMLLMIFLDGGGFFIWLALKLNLSFLNFKNLSCHPLEFINNTRFFVAPSPWHASEF